MTPHPGESRAIDSRFETGPVEVLAPQQVSRAAAEEHANARRIKTALEQSGVSDCLRGGMDAHAIAPGPPASFCSRQAGIHFIHPHLGCESTPIALRIEQRHVADATFAREHAAPGVFARRAKTGDQSDADNRDSTAHVSGSVSSGALLR